MTFQEIVDTLDTLGENYPLPEFTNEIQSLFSKLNPNYSSLIMVINNIAKLKTLAPQFDWLYQNGKLIKICEQRDFDWSQPSFIFKMKENVLYVVRYEPAYRQ